MSNPNIYMGIKPESRAQEYFVFGICDSRGRSIGARITYAIAETGPESQRRWRLAPVGAPAEGDLYAMTVHATRSGEDFGASQPWRFFLTEADRDRARDKYLDGAKARAMRVK